MPAELEAEAEAFAEEEEARRRAEAEEKRVAEGRKKNGKTPKAPSEEPNGKAQRNFTDPQSRVLLTKDGYIQGWNAQAAVDGTAQVIVARLLMPKHPKRDVAAAQQPRDMDHIDSQKRQRSR